MTLTRREMLKLLGAAGGLALLPRGVSSLRAQDDTAPLIVDGHLDIGWNLINYKRDYTQSAYAIRAAEAGTATQNAAGLAMVGAPELLAGHVALIVGTIFVIPAAHVFGDLQIARYRTIEEAHNWGTIMLEAITALAAQEPFALVQTAGDLDAVLATWAPDAPVDRRRVGIMLAMEGADPIQTPGELPEWYARGLRGIGLSWSAGTQYCGGNDAPGDLTNLGHELLAEMAALGMLLDTAHMSEQAFWTALDVWGDGPVAYTHGIPRLFLDAERALSDEQITALVERDGVVGVSPYDYFFGRRRISPHEVTVEDVANALDYVCQVAGDCTHTVIGSDVDGGFGAESSPLDTVADLPQIGAALARRGYTQDEIAAILSGNWLRLLRRVLPDTRVLPDA